MTHQAPSIVNRDHVSNSSIACPSCLLRACIHVLCSSRSRPDSLVFLFPVHFEYQNKTSRSLKHLWMSFVNAGLTYSVRTARLCSRGSLFSLLTYLSMTDALSKHQALSWNGSSAVSRYSWRHTGDSSVMPRSSAPVALLRVSSQGFCEASSRRQWKPPGTVAFCVLPCALLLARQTWATGRWCTLMMPTERTSS